MNSCIKILLPLCLMGCTTTEDGNVKVNLFTLEDDIELGLDLRNEIAADPENYPILDPNFYPDAYAHLYEIRDAILESGEVHYADEFDWELYIIEDDETLNAFCAPGGYIYVYTGLMKFLEYEDQLAGVLGHEIAHADLRHSTEQLTKAYGISVLLEILFEEEPGLLGEIAAGLASLSFSRDDETESDIASVDYLCSTNYAADGAAGFFEKLDSFELPEFLSTHPSSDTRVEDISSYAIEKGCSLEYNPNSNYQALLDSLP
jgi:beta-barrel assembly-enhancing protease